MFVTIGIDVSTSIVGISIFETENQKFVETHYVDLRKIDDFYEKCEKFKDNFENIVGKFCSEASLSKNSINNVFVEDKLGGFAAGGTMMQTLMKLASFNSTVSYIIMSEYGIKPIHIHPSTIKASMKKEGLVIPKGIKGDVKKKVVLDWVSSKFKDFNVELTKNDTPKPYMYDQADAVCVALAGFKKE